MQRRRHHWALTHARGGVRIREVDHRESRTHRHDRRVALDGHPDVHALAGDTDGVDGDDEVAGAYLAPDSLARARALGLRPVDRLADNDGHGFFGALDDAVVTGPTLTNVNDFRAILIAAPRAAGGP